MKSLYNYISYYNKHHDKIVIDCHTHMFGQGTTMNYPYEYPINGLICMINNSIRYPDRSLIDDFKLYINLGEVTDRKKLLCVGKDVDETLSIYNTYKEKFSGFGEIKCYKKYTTTLKRYDTSILRAVINKGLPVFIHWDLDGTHDEELYNIIHDNPDTKFVLCHCGINELYDPSKSFQTAIQFQNKLLNLWLSISWVALDYFVQDDFQSSNNKLSLIPIPDHTLVGTDFNPEMDHHNISFEDRYKKFIKIYNKFDVPVALNNLFS